MPLNCAPYAISRGASVPKPLSIQDYLALIDLELNQRAKTDLYDFVAEGWRHAGLPGDFVGGWHIRLLCDRLMEINRSGWGRLMWASPPRSSKSTVHDVFWPAWTWLQPTDFTKLLGPWVQFLHVTHRDDLAVRDSQRCRRLIKSDWYQELCEGRIQILPDSDQSAYFALAGGGSRRAFGIRAAITGHDSDIQVVGDPYDVEAVLSVAERTHAEFVWDEVLPSRFNHPTRNAQVLAAQRTHVSDLHAHVMDSADWSSWRYDCIPGIRTADQRHVSEGDARAAGEVYWPQRFDERSLMALCKTAHARAAQIQQDPQQRGAGVFAKARWEFADDYPRNIRLVRYWDRAASAEGGGGDPDYTAGALGGFDELGLFWLVDMIRGRWSSLEVEQRIRLTAQEIDGPQVPIWIEEEPGASGKESTMRYQRMLRGFAVRGDRPTGPKLTRVDPLLAAAEAGNVVLVRRRYYGNGIGVGSEASTWIGAFIAECDEFTGDDSVHDDQVIAAVGAFNRAASTGHFSVGRLLGV
jgi:predicted phage terminase large subunit-like protein